LSAVIFTVTFNLCTGIKGVNGEQVACPHCGEHDRLAIRVVPDETGDEPVYVRCQWGHLWAEPSLPRRVFADLLAQVAAADPETWARLNRVMAERGGITLGPQ